MTKIENKQKELNDAVDLLSETVNSLDDKRKQLVNDSISKIIEFLQLKVESADLDITSSDIINAIILLCNQISDRMNNSLEWSENEIRNIKIDTATLLRKIPLIQSQLNLLSPKSEQFYINLQKESQDNFDKVNTQLAQHLTEAKEHLKKLENLEFEGKAQVQILAGKVLNNFYQQRADEELKKARKWTWATWVFAIATLVILGLIIILGLGSIPTSPVDYQFLGTKFLAIATFGLIAKWTSKRANRHLAEEAKYHRLAVNMATLVPFTETLKEDTKDKLLSEVASKIFTDGTGNDTATDYEAGSLDFIKGFLEKSGK